MRLRRSVAFLGVLLTMSACRQSAYIVPETPMPPNTILLSQMMRELSEQPDFLSDLLDTLDPKHAHEAKRGPALLTPELLDELRNRVFGRDWQGLDRFPGWNMGRINSTVKLAGKFAKKHTDVEASTEVHPGAPFSSEQARMFLDIGPYALDQQQTVSLDEPSPFPPFSTEGIVTDLGHGVTRGDGPNELAPEHTESQRLACLLNRLAANKLPGVHPFSVVSFGKAVSTPEELIAALAAAGTKVTVIDARYFANFAHLHYKGQDVMAPFWINTGMIVPNSGGRPLLIPVAHAELEWKIRGPLVNADVSYYFGVDGKSEWRVMDTLDQAWVLKRAAHTYTGEQAIEATRLAGLLTVAYMHLHEAHPQLPFGGYYALGVCQDGVSAIERKLTGVSTLFPNTADVSFFTDARDADVNALIAALPKDREATHPDAARVFGSLPVAPDASGRFDAVTIPGLAADLNATYPAWKNGSLEHTSVWWARLKTWLFFLAALATAIMIAMKTRLFRGTRWMQRNSR